MKIEGRLKQFNFKDTMNMLMINKANLLVSILKQK